jgi:NTP pyrophosphatase (non-canonical NTP hydrolase)
MAARLNPQTIARLRQHLEVEEAMGDPEVSRALEMLLEWHDAGGAQPPPALAFAGLRHANEARDEEWNTGAEKISLAFRGVELAGEAGEACNVIKKLERGTLGIAGSRASLADLASELADVVICADLIAMHAGIDLEAAVVEKFNATSQKYRLATRITLAEEA